MSLNVTNAIFIFWSFTLFICILAQMWKIYECCNACSFWFSYKEKEYNSEKLNYCIIAEGIFGQVREFCSTSCQNIPKWDGSCRGRDEGCSCFHVNIVDFSLLDPLMFLCHSNSWFYNIENIYKGSIYSAQLLFFLKKSCWWASSYFSYGLTDKIKCVVFHI